MKVWLVFDRVPGTDTLIGVFSSEEEAASVVSAWRAYARAKEYVVGEMADGFDDPREEADA